MDAPEFSSWKPKPEYDSHTPELLFSYAAEKEQWLKRRVNAEQLPDAIDGLANDLTEHVLHSFDSLPYITVESKDIWQTRNVSKEPGELHIRFNQKPLDGDAELFGEHTVQGMFDSFHVGNDGELRVNIQSAQDDILVQGFHGRPLYSVRVENSKIQFAEFVAQERLAAVSLDIAEKVRGGMPERTAQLVEHFIKELDQPAVITELKLQKSALLLGAINRQTAGSPQLLDSLLEMLKLKLRLDVPLDIKVNNFRNVVKQDGVEGHTAGEGPKVFEAVVPILGFTGDGDARGLALFIVDSDRAVRIPVYSIAQIRKTET